MYINEYPILQNILSKGLRVKLLAGTKHPI